MRCGALIWIKAEKSIRFSNLGIIYKSSFEQIFVNLC